MNHKWIFRAIIVTFLLAVVFSLIAEMVLRNLNIVFAIFVFLFIIFIGIFFDAIGIAFAVADIKPFNSMAARKIKGSKRAVELIQKSAMVSNFCNDVVGDISGIISGSVGAIIIVSIQKYDIYLRNISVFTILLASVTASMTVGGKAIGKGIAVKYWRTIVYRFAYLVDALERILRKKIF